jgi:hypothetical protein
MLGAAACTEVQGLAYFLYAAAGLLVLLNVCIVIFALYAMVFRCTRGIPMTNACGSTLIAVFIAHAALPVWIAGFIVTPATNKWEYE